MPKYLRTIFIVAGILAFLCALPWILGIFAPFLAAFLIATASQRLLRFLEKKVRISRSISSAVLIALIVAFTGGLFVFIFVKLANQSRQLFLALPEIIRTFVNQTDGLYLKYQELATRLSPEAAGYIDEFINDFQTYMKTIGTSISENALLIAKNMVFSLPKMLAFIITFLIATFFMTKDYRLILNFFRELLPRKAPEKLKYMRDKTFGVFFSCLKAQLILMCITFSEASVGLWIIGIDYAIVIGLIIGIVDALPFFGSGIILIPWAVCSFLLGDYVTAVALTAIQIICFIVRQVLEPKIVSSQIGVHPLLTIVSVYAGLKAFGVAGMLLGPVITVLAANLYISYKEGVTGTW